MDKCLARTGDKGLPKPSVTVQQLHGAVDEVVLQRHRYRASVAVQQLGGVVDGKEVRGPVLPAFLPIRRLAAVERVFFGRASQEYMHVLSVSATTTAHAVQLQAKLQQAAPPAFSPLWLRLSRLVMG